MFDDERPSQPTSTVTVRNAALVMKLFDNDRRFMVGDIAGELSLIIQCNIFLQTS